MGETVFAVQVRAQERLKVTCLLRDKIDSYYFILIYLK